MEESHCAKDKTSAPYRVVYRTRTVEQKEFDTLRGRVIVLEGGIAAGKSLFGHSLAYHLNAKGIQAKYFPEFVDDKLLTLYLTDRKRYGFPFQLTMAQSRIVTYKNEVTAYAKTGGVAIVDRFILGDNAFERMLYDEGIITDQEHEVYWSVMKKLEAYDEPDFTVYFECTSQTCLERVRIRGVPSEVNTYTYEMFERLHDAHRKVFAGHSVINVDHNKNLFIESNGCICWRDVRAVLRAIIAR